MTVVCVHAPTAKAPPGVKEKFSCELQDTLDKVPRNDVLVLLGDFNARVGVLKSDEEEWQGVVGRNGLDERNEAGEDLEVLCSKPVDSDEHVVSEEAGDDESRTEDVL